LDVDVFPSRRTILWDRARESLSAGRFWSAILVLLLTITVARSTSTVHWVDGIDVIGVIAVVAALLLGTLAVLPVREPLALGIGVLLAPVAAVAGAWPQIHARHATDAIGPQLIGVWWNRITDGTASQDPSFYLVLICLLMWITGGWLAWCVLRWRKPMLGLIPGAAAFATNVLNVPIDQNGYTLAMLVLTLALLLWTNYTGSIANAVRASVKLTGDARWDFWESGLVAMAALIVLGIMLPPLSTADRTLDLESGIFSSWAQLQQRLSHPGIFSSGSGGGVTGFTEDVKLSGPLQRTRDVVFTYNVVGEYASSARYFRGLNETVNLGSEWRYANANGVKETVLKNQTPTYAEEYQKLAVAGFNVRMLRPPVGNPDILFYPSQLYKVDRVTLATQVPLRPSQNSGDLYSVDRLSSLQPANSSGNYVVTVEYSTATQAELEGAGTNYADWVRQFSAPPAYGYRSQVVLEKIHRLALSIVDAAGAVTPYDKAAAIESYLRDPSKFQYTLEPPKTPDGMDPLDFFLFTSKKGYCEFFASAMGDMLRSLGIPTRLVNGFGPGNFDTSANAFVVRGEDAHTWVEVYFPAPAGSTQAYGWIPFEPTADGNYLSIQRGQTGVGLCLRDDGCDQPISAAGSGAGAVATPKSRNIGPDINAGSTGGGLRVGALDASALTKIAGFIVALLLLLIVAASRYLRPRTVMAVWRRMLTLTSLAGAERPPGETPMELGRRLQRTFPEAAEPVGALTSGFVVAAYAPPDVASTSRTSVMEAWTQLRPMLLRRIFARLSPTRP
jgi:transglutaminase-like putative cysteine protease